MNPISKFGIFLFSGSSASLLVLKAMTSTHIGTRTAFYSDLTAFATLIGVFLAISITLIFSAYIKSFIILILVFVAMLIFSFVMLAPLLLGSV